MKERENHHPTPKQYVQIAIILGILTAIEVALYYTEEVVGVFTDPLLIILAISKFIVVVSTFFIKLIILLSYSLSKLLPFCL